LPACPGGFRRRGWLYHKRDDDWKHLRLGGGQPASARAFKTVLRDRFARPEPITEQSIENGALLDGCELLLLPQQLNLGDAAAEAIQAYVRGGGAVLADVMPATRHRMGKPRGGSALADVFGVDFTAARLEADSEPWTVKVESPGHASRPLLEDSIPLSARVTFTGLRPTTARAHAIVRPGKDDQPAVRGCFTNTFGQGRALLLNFVLPEPSDDLLERHHAFADALLRWSGVGRPAWRIVEPETGRPLPFRTLHRFTRGQATLLGCVRGRFVGGNNPRLRDPAPERYRDDEATFTWSGRSHAYDVRRGAYLGHKESVTIDLPPFRGRLLCLLPYRVRGVDLSGPRSARPGRRITVAAEVTASGRKPGEHVIHFEVTSPTGARRPLYCRTRTAAHGRAELTIPFAHNDPPGQWTIRARDVMTGITTTRHVRLEPGP